MLPSNKLGFPWPTHHGIGLLTLRHLVGIDQVLMLSSSRPVCHLGRPALIRGQDEAGKDSRASRHRLPVACQHLQGSNYGCGKKKKG